MLLMEYDYATDIEVQREEAFEKGVSKGLQQGISQGEYQAKIETAKGNRAEAEKLYDKAFAMKGIALPILNLQKTEAGRAFPKYKEKK